MKTIAIHLYTTSAGQQPFISWLKKLEKKTRTIINQRLIRLRIGNLGDCKPIRGSNGVYELRVDYGPGYRVYFGKSGSTIVVLLVGGDKGSQSRDIAKANQYWLDFKEREHD